MIIKLFMRQHKCDQLVMFFTILVPYKTLAFDHCRNKYSLDSTHLSSPSCNCRSFVARSIDCCLALYMKICIREGCNKKKRKKCGIFHIWEEQPPPSKKGGELSNSTSKLNIQNKFGFGVTL